MARMKESELLTTTEVAKLFRVDRTTIIKWSDEGQLNFIRTLGGHRRYNRNEVMELLRQHTSERIITE